MRPVRVEEARQKQNIPGGGRLGEGCGCGQELGPGERVGAVAGVVRLGLRGCAEDFRPYPRSNMKLLRGFKQLRE